MTQAEDQTAFKMLHPCRGLHFHEGAAHHVGRLVLMLLPRYYITRQEGF
jgi:hypothetical protein